MLKVNNGQGQSLYAVILAKWWALHHTRRRSTRRLSSQKYSLSRDSTHDCNWSELLRRPGTLFISHENAYFLFSVFRVVQGEAKTPKIMGCCRVNFAFLHALKIGTFRGKWTLEWVIKTSHFVLLALYFLITSKLAFFLIASQRCLARTAKKCLS